MRPVNSGNGVTKRTRVRAVSDGRSAWIVYFLRCADGTLYAGATVDMEKRLRAHAAGRVKYTRGRLPVALAWSEHVGAHGDALRREAELKRLRRAAKEALIAAGPRTSA